ncbi:winged helix-turn-helix domain-containing protein [Candidatus Bathyarchaeota archaeon]|nr:winged helix-turn-helix domain-containing protein [Candidatus Bathyarchaeota archaeon]
MTLPKRRERDKLLIVAEILEIAKNGAMKTQIMYRANLSFTKLNDYLRFMLKIGLLEKVEVFNKDIYKATDKGLDFLTRFLEIHELIKSEEAELASQREMSAEAAQGDKPKQRVFVLHETT